MFLWKNNIKFIQLFFEKEKCLLQVVNLFYVNIFCKCEMRDASHPSKGSLRSPNRARFAGLNAGFARNLRKVRAEYRPRLCSASDAGRFFFGDTNTDNLWLSDAGNADQMQKTPKWKQRVSRWHRPSAHSLRLGGLLGHSSIRTSAGGLPPYRAGGIPRSPLAFIRFYGFIYQ